MLNGKKIIVVMPAYNAAKTLKKTYEQIPRDIVDDIILVDDRSSDETVKQAEKLNIKTFIHEKNKGYGGNQKTCYQEALKLGADIVVMLHPDYQYDPRLITALSSMIASGVYDVALGSRILGGESVKGGMPRYKYYLNRILTFIQNLATGKKLSEYHTGYRAFSRKVLTSIPLNNNSDDFVFDNQMLMQIIFFNFKIGEISCPTKYEPESSSINFKRSCEYGIGVIFTIIQFFIAKSKITTINIFSEEKAKINLN
ncbi:MAG TPA: glycosyltransferase family 2 protein [bacterium]|nr:glycosyltransferase family 2 protein [bacterium]